MDDKELLTLDMPLQRMKRSAWVAMPLPDSKAAIRFIGWASGRLAFMALSTSLSIIKNAAKAVIWISEKIEDGLKLLTHYYDALPYMGMPQDTLTLEAIPANQGASNLQTPSVDILAGIAGKHLLIIGDTGSGKSTIAQYIAARNSSQIKVYDADAAPDDWQGLKVVGKGGDFGEINASMNADIDELENRIKLRSQSGDNALTGKELCIIAEEFPSLKDECEIAPEWLGKLARRGRKPKIFVIALSQSDSVKALGIEGDGAIRQNFKYLRLGKFAVQHAKKLGNDAMVNWLQSGKYRAMLDDEPAQMPSIDSTLLVHTRLLDSRAIAGENPPEPPPEMDLTNLPHSLKPAILALKQEGWSDSKLIKEVLGYSGGNYQKGKLILDELLGRGQ